jgi:hypothetical protein
MSAIIADAELRDKLNGLNEVVEVKSTEGKVLGRFVPEDEYQQMEYALAMAACPFTDEELERRSKETGGSSLADFWKRMGRA